MKGGEYSELKSLERFQDLITVEQYGTVHWVSRPPKEEDRKRAMAGLERVQSIVRSGEYDVVILDEIIVAFRFTLLTLRQLIDLIEIRPDDVEMVLTGRGAPEDLIQRADLVTEMREIKHYHSLGVPSRKGIEE